MATLARIPLLLSFICIGWILPAVAAGQEPTIEEILKESENSGLGNARLHRMLDFAEQLDSSKQLSQALDRVLADNAHGRHHELARTLYARWTELDLPAALRHARAQTGNSQFVTLGAVIAIWAAQDSEAAWAWFEKEGAKLEQKIVGHSILREVAREEPEKALAMFEESAVLRNSPYGNSPAFLYGVWAGNDPPAAASRLAKEKNYWLRREAASRILMLWMEKDRDAAWAWIETLPRKSEQLVAKKTFFGALAAQDLSGAKELVEKLPEGPERTVAAKEITGRLIIGDPVAAFDFAREHLPMPSGSHHFSMIFDRWATIDAERAFTVAREKLKPGQTRKMSLERIVQSVSTRDADRASAMLEEIGLDRSYTFAASSVAKALAQQDLKKALPWADGMPEGEMKKSALSEVISEWVEESPEDAAAIGLERASDDPQKTLLQKAISRWSYLDPAAAVEWIQRKLDPSTQRLLLPSAVGRWGEVDLQVASGWAKSLPPDEAGLRAACLANLGSTWANYDPLGGERWLATLEPGPDRDKTVGNFAHRVFSHDPGISLKWALKIEDQAQRSRAIEQTAHRYLRSQPKKAREWIEGSSLPEDVRKQLLGDKQ